MKHKFLSNISGLFCPFGVHGPIAHPCLRKKQSVIRADAQIPADVETTPIPSLVELLYTTPMPAAANIAAL